MTRPTSLCCPHCPIRQAQRQDPEAHAYSILGIALGLFALAFTVIFAIAIAGDLDSGQSVTARMAVAICCAATAILCLPLGFWSLIRSLKAQSRQAAARKQRRLAESGCL